MQFNEFPATQGIFIYFRSVILETFLIKTSRSLSEMESSLTIELIVSEGQLPPSSLSLHIFVFFTLACISQQYMHE